MKNINIYKKIFDFNKENQIKVNESITLNDFIIQYENS
jgi:hypothetical protein